MERKVRARSESIAFVAVVTAALVLLNLLSLKAFGRIDLTKRQLFTLSDGTRRIVGGLRDQLTITVYFTPNQPPPANDDERFLRDQLDEYRSISNGRVKVQFVTPDNDERRRAADAAGCEKAPLQSVDQQQEQATIQEVYRCVAFEYLGRREKIAFLPPGVQGLEYELSSIIKNLSLPEGERERTIGFLGGHGELTPEEGMQYLPQLIEQARLNYRTRTVNLNGGENDVPSDIKGLVIMNPTQRITERELRKLDAYLMRGGSVAVFAGGANFPANDPGSANGSEAEHHLNDWLDGYGIHLQNNVILDLRASDAVVQFGRYRGRVRLVTWPEIASFTGGTPTEAMLREQGGVDPSFPVTFRLPGFVSTYPSEIRINDAQRRTAGGALKIFAMTGPRSILRTDLNIDIRQILQQGPGQFTNAAQHGPYPVGVALQGPFRSAFAGRAETASADGGAPPVPTPGASVPERSNDRARIMVLSAGNMFALDTLRTLMQISGGQSPNLQIIPNTFDWLSQDTDLLAVRAKDTSDPQMRADVSDKAKRFFKWGSIALLPAAIGILGFAVLSARRSRIKNLAKEFGAKG